VARPCRPTRKRRFRFRTSGTNRITRCAASLIRTAAEPRCTTVAGRGSLVRAHRIHSPERRAPMGRPSRGRDPTAPGQETATAVDAVSDRPARGHAPPGRRSDGDGSRRGPAQLSATDPRSCRRRMKRAIRAAGRRQQHSGPGPETPIKLAPQRSVSLEDHGPVRTPGPTTGWHGPRVPRPTHESQPESIRHADPGPRQSAKRHLLSSATLFGWHLLPSATLALLHWSPPELRPLPLTARATSSDKVSQAPPA
jgi:hypothetical protein